jgi:hypothetical protein
VLVARLEQHAKREDAYGEWRVFIRPSISNVALRDRRLCRVMQIVLCMCSVGRRVSAVPPSAAGALGSASTTGAVSGDCARTTGE